MQWKLHQEWNLLRARKSICVAKFCFAISKILSPEFDSAKINRCDFIGDHMQVLFRFSAAGIFSSLCASELRMVSRLNTSARERIPAIKCEYCTRFSDTAEQGFSFLNFEN